MSQERERQLWGIVLAAGEGSRVREFLTQLCGGRGIKQFCAVIGHRSMLHHTLGRIEPLIPRERTLVVVSTEHRTEAAAQLSHWPVENIIFQPRNRDTAPGILLPLAHLSHRAPFANVAIFPSDHFILDEDRFMRAVARAAAEVRRFQQELILLGIAPDKAEEGYGWIEPAPQEAERETRAVQRFWEKPSSVTARALLARGALWNTFVCVAWAPTLWGMVQHVAPDLAAAFTKIRNALGKPHATIVTEQVYETLRAVNFSAGICEPLAPRLRVLPVPDVGWSDWGSIERIRASLAQMGKLEECLARLRHRKGEADVVLPYVKQRRPLTGLS
jgi:mannose-1-phosphate guanylyltransferase